MGDQGNPMTGPVESNPNGSAGVGAGAGGARRWIVLAMITLFMAINFADKSVIGLAGPRIMAELKLRPDQFGLIGSSFFFLFSISSVLVGFAADRMRSVYVLAGLSIVWALSQLPVIFAASFATILVSRILLGMGEGPAYPMAMHAAYRWFGNHERTMPTAIIQKGATAGLTLSGPLLTWLMIRYDWQAPFAALAIVGVIWTVLWLLLAREGNITARTAAPGPLDGRGIGTLRVMCDRSTLASLLMYFVAYAMIAVYFTWFPSYLRLELGFSETTTGWLYSVVSASWIPLHLLATALSARMTARGVSSRIARGLFCGIGICVGGAFYVALHLDIPPVAKVVAIAIAGLFGQFTSTFGPLVVSEISPSDKRGSTLGLFSAIGTLGGVVSPLVMGYFVVREANGATHGFENGYVAMGLCLIVVGVVGALLVDPERSIARMKQESEA